VPRIFKKERNKRRGYMRRRELVIRKIHCPRDTNRYNRKMKQKKRNPASPNKK
jgi:hypothetical protein